MSSDMNQPTIKINVPPVGKSSASSELKKLLSFGKTPQSSSGTNYQKQNTLQFKQHQTTAQSQNQGPPTAVFGKVSLKKVEGGVVNVTKVDKIAENYEQEMIRESWKKEPMKIIHDKELVITNLSSIPDEDSIHEIDLDGIRDTNVSARSKKGAKLSVKEEKKQNLNESVATPTFHNNQHNGFPPTFNKKPSNLAPVRSQLQHPPQNHKIRLRDYLFMVNTSVEAAAKKRTQDIQQNKTLFIEQAQFQDISRCQSAVSLGRNNRYHSEKYKINNHQIGTLLKKDVRSQICILKEKLKELEEAVDDTCDHLSQKDISAMLELRRFLETSNSKCQEISQKIRPNNSQLNPIDMTKESVVLVQVPEEERTALQQPPLIGTFHKKQSN